MNLSQHREYLNLCKTPHNPCHSYTPEMILALWDFQIMLFCTIDSYLVHLFYWRDLFLSLNLQTVPSTLKSKQLELHSEREP